MSVLVLGPDEAFEINAAIQRAKANAVPLQAIKHQLDGTDTSTLLLKDRKPGSTDFRKQYRSQEVMLGTYRASLSFEHQPSGLFKHLSVSSANSGKIPGPQVMGMVCEAFGFSKAICDAFLKSDGKPLKVIARVWLEEYEPNRHAVNVLELVGEPIKGGKP